MTLHRVTLRSLALLALLAVFSTPLWASPAVFELDNGDRISGTLVQMIDGGFVVATTWGGELTIAAPSVVSMTTDEPVTIVLEDDETVVGRLESQDGEVTIHADGAVTRAPFASLQAINPPPAVTRHLVVAAGANLQQGNSETSSLSVSIDGSRRSDHHRITYGGRWNRAEESSVTTADNTFVNLKYDRFFEPAWYAFGSLEGARDELKDLDLQTRVGAGVGWQAIADPKLDLNLEAGVAYVRDDRIDSEDEEEVTARFASRLDWRPLDRLDLTNQLLVYPSFESDGGTQLRNEFTLSTSIVGGLALAMTYVFEWDEEPAPGVEETDQLFVLGIQYQIK
ncbi:MAG: DUF481 domain-containing protein [Acidobacteriota bacterium]